MSVAFRRESDEEHKEPRFELPIPPGPNLVTPRGRALIDARIAELDAAQAEAEADEPRRVTAILAPAPPADEIAFGSRVEFTLNGEPRTIEIVGDDEADPAAGKIAFSAPLARALIGAGEGDVLPFAGRDDAIEVIAVEATFAD